MKDFSLEGMLLEIREQADLLVTGFTDVDKQSKEILGGNCCRDINKIYIVGCGDSYHAGIACQEVFMKYTGVPTEAYQALEFSRYVYPNVTPNSLVLGISNSGEVARTVECIMRANRKNLWTIGVTRNPESKLARESRNTLEVKIPSVVGKLPGTRSYMGSLIALIGFALNLGVHTGRITDVQKADAEDYLKEMAVAIGETIDSEVDKIGEYVNKENIDIYHLVGSGPNFATAQFGSMKLLEAGGFASIPQGVEEWAHSQYFVTRPGVHVVFLAAKGAAHDRALEVMPAVKTVGGRLVVIAEEDDTEVEKVADYVFKIKGLKEIREEFSAVIYAVPLELLAYQIAKKLKANPMDFEGNPEKQQENFKQIWSSCIVCE